uniref:protein ANKUB1 isoform X1 n=2 Tax=Ictidomys tridecemlineatus TaxID=43179 RepID=UPI001A9E0C4D|nr:protein ANKUB1 isoform X1 [Ictidomys tridecemlineatus]XP_040125940.1 protein ANKUB1 isoform X1 [Ictidomys tridecemlineatus]XP_040125941.1 protein ANKUB1 isoform X1 [Ictidomys tridecemlineatus]
MMRIFIAFEGSFEPFDVSADETVEAIKLMIKDYFHIPLSEDEQGKRYLELMYAGAALRNSWSLADVGISFCSTLKCFIKEEDKPTLYVFNAVTQETMPIMESVSLLGKTVSDLRTEVTLRCGLPVSVYCLRTPTGLEMYDRNTLRDYQTHLGMASAVGTTLRLDVWDGWKEFLMGCLLGQKLKVQRYLSREGPVLKYQRRVALYIAAFYGYAELTEWALKQGARPHEAVGAHPYRAWCHEALHADVSKCPIHAAAEAGQLLVLKTFVHCSVLCLECKDPAGQTPLAIASKHRHKDCVLYLLNKMWSTVSFLKISVPMRIYIKIKQWILRAQSHSLRRSQLCRAGVRGAKVGDIVMVDGFTQPKMTSKSWHKAGNQDSQGNSSKLPPLRGHATSRKPGDSVAVPQRDAGDGPLVLPPLVDADAFSELHQQQSQIKITSTAWRKEGRMKNAYLPQVPLPPFLRAGCSHPCYSTARSEDVLLKSCFASFQQHSGRTPRENAIYCLAVASAFKEKRWLQQLGIARALAKKSISHLTTHRGLAADENPPEMLL